MSVSRFYTDSGMAGGTSAFSLEEGSPAYTDAQLDILAMSSSSSLLGYRNGVKTLRLRLVRVRGLLSSPNLAILLSPSDVTG